jgi:myo-inositol-1(or 4)-monophosphatase
MGEKTILRPYEKRAGMPIPARLRYTRWKFVQPSPKDKSPVLNIPTIRAWISEAGNIALHYFGRQIDTEWKDPTSPVTAADREIERLLRDEIRAAYPDHGLLGEEYGGDELDREYLWLVDPIDGTRAFIEGLPSWSITIALLHKLQPVFGLVYMPLYDDWTFTDGDDVIHEARAQSRHVITHALKTHWDHGSYILWRSDAASVYDLHFTRMLSMGTSASHLAYTARGSALAALVHDSFAWDIAAGAAFIAKQGGDFRFLNGEQVDFAQMDLTQRITGMYVAGHPDVVARLLPLIVLREEPVTHPVW